MNLSTLSEIFVPIFVAMSPLTVLPIFLSMTEGSPQQQSRALAHRAVVTAFFIAVSLVLIGQELFRFLGITVDDLRVAGGLILLLIAIYDLIFTQEKRKSAEIDADAGVVPLGTPLIVGPATMTTSVVLADTHGAFWVIVILCINLVGIGLLLHFSDRITRFINPAISKAFGKVMSLFLAAIAVAMLRSGIFAFIEAAP